MWINHHALFKNVQHVTHGIVLTNLLLLSLISFLPFPTEVLGKYGITSVAIVYYATPWNIVGLTLYPRSAALRRYAGFRMPSACARIPFSRPRWPSSNCRREIAMVPAGTSSTPRRSRAVQAKGVFWSSGWNRFAD